MPAMLAEDANLHLPPSQIETMLQGVVSRHLAKLERVALAAKCARGFDPERARMDDKPGVLDLRPVGRAGLYGGCTSGGSDPDGG
ncbi:hypothetical protein AAFG13_38655 [Bradyrhizobium sp. B124]|uniref:hypothetical protein n=1 Tax=Bradyrhizobium sp. B124 TaxID=3140245 RepID=UPI0031845997